MTEHGAGRRPAVITGASSGIGLELARLFARDGFDVVMVARASGRLDAAVRAVATEAPATRVTSIGCDLAEPGAAQSLFAQLDQAHITPYAFVNNAGFGLRGRFVATNLSAEVEMIQVNVTALTELTKFALARMRPGEGGRILNVASTAAFQPGPHMAVYYATKAYVLSFSEAVASETRGTNVTVTTLCPGPTATRFEERAGLSGSRLFRAYVVNAESVARAGYDGLMHGKRLVIPGFRNKLLAQSVRFAPRAAVLAVAKWLQG